MSTIAADLSALVGETPLLRLSRLCAREGVAGQVLAKLEGLNPAGSAKDRVAREMLDRAEAEGRLAPGGTVIEPTSGNTGVGLAALGAARGYRVVLTMPASMSAERKKLLLAYGAELVLVEGGMRAAVEKAEALHAALPGSIIAGQFSNPANPAAHEKATGPELWRATDGQLAAFVAGVGTGGTLTGCGRYLKQQSPQLWVLGVEPADSPLLTEGRSGAHGLQGIGADFIPAVFDRRVCDELLPVTQAQAVETARKLAQSEGVLCGFSGGAALYAALRLAARERFAGRQIAVLLPDSGERYLSTDLFSC